MLRLASPKGLARVFFFRVCVCVGWAMSPILERAIKIQRERDRKAREESRILGQKPADLDKMGMHVPNFVRVEAGRVMSPAQRELADRANAATTFVVGDSDACPASVWFEGAPSSRPHARVEGPGMAHFLKWASTASVADMLD